MATLLESEVNSAVALALRVDAGMNQQEFWAVFGVTQSGGSRYENGRAIPKPVRMLVAGCSGIKANAALASHLWSMGGRRVEMVRKQVRSSTNRGRGHAGIRKAAGQGRTRQHAA